VGFSLITTASGQRLFMSVFLKKENEVEDK
jgi:hypothetical protein